MKKRIACFIILIMMIMAHSCLAATYTLPEKMYNQLAIGSGLKGTFSITAEGEKFQTRFLKAISDAEYSIRGLSSGKELHYYVFQGDEKEQQTAVSELYRKDGTYYFKSNMVEGKIIKLPLISQILESVFPAKGENRSASSFVSNILTLPEEVMKEKWEPVLTRYQNELEFWLADFAVKHTTVKLDSGISALDFTYEIPADKICEKTVELIGEIASDSEASALMDSVMTAEEKNLYLNANLLYFYQETLQSMSSGKPVIMNKRVSAMGDLLRFRLELPLNDQATGYQSISIEMIDKQTVYTIKKADEILILAIPDIKALQESEFEESVWFSRIITEENAHKDDQNVSIRADIRKTHKESDEKEKNKSHETDEYNIQIEKDTTYLPEDISSSIIPDSEPIHAEIILHYSSKYAQNNATTLEIIADIAEESSKSRLHIEGNVKTAAPWIFMPFEIVDPIEPGTEWKKVIDNYMEDWTSNAESMIRHGIASPDATEKVTVQETENTENHTEKNEAEDSENEAETKPLDE